MTNTLTDFKEMILTEEEKEHAVEYYILEEKRKKENVFGRKVREYDASLIEYDRDELIQEANERKHHRIEMERIRQEAEEQRIKAKNDFNDYWSYQRMYNLLLWESNNMGFEFEYCDDNKIAVQALCFLLSDSERFETDLGFDPKKGIILRGKYGVGKTHMVRCLSKNDRNPIHMMSMIEVKEKVANDGHHYMGSPKSFIYLDDVGSEDLPLMHYGTKINWFKDFIEKRYFMNEGFNKIILSTNLSIKELTEKYGERVTDRIAEMFNIIDVKGTSRRIKAIKEKKNKKDGTTEPETT